MLPNIRDQEIDQMLRWGAKAFRRELADASVASARRLQSAYSRLIRDLDAQIGELQSVAAEKGMSSAKLAREAALIRLRDALKDSLKDMTKVIQGEANKMQANGVANGAQYGVKAMDQIGLTPNFGRVSVQQFRALVNYADSPAFRASLANYPEYHSQKVADMVIAAGAAGTNPIATARLVRQYVTDMPLADAVRMTRTVQLWSARRGTQEIFRSNGDIVGGWIWSSARDGRTCPACWAEDGKFHSNDEILDGHHLCRCAMVPVTVTWAGLGFQGGTEVTAGWGTGEDAFGQLSQREQQGILGMARWLAWKDGAFQFGDLAETYQNPIYGTMRQERSLISLVGAETATSYKQKARAA